MWITVFTMKYDRHNKITSWKRKWDKNGVHNQNWQYLASYVDKIKYWTLLTLFYWQEDRFNSIGLLFGSQGKLFSSGSDRNIESYPPFHLSSKVNLVFCTVISVLSLSDVSQSLTKSKIWSGRLSGLKWDYSCWIFEHLDLFKI